MKANNKIKTPFAKIIVGGTVEKPYYDIMWYDPADGEIHIGFGSYCLEYVFKWLSEEFEIVEEPHIEVPRWIPVTQREPCEEAMKFFGEFGEWPEFLVMIKGGLVPTTLFFGPDEWFDSAENTYSVTHWMPLPKGPQEG